MTDTAALEARAAALDLIEAVLRRRQLLDETFEAHPALPALAPRDRAFARLLVATVLRRLGQIDALIARALDRPDRTRPLAIDLLRLGLAQLVFLGTPAHAAVDTTVALADRRRQPSLKGLVNAVLRRLSRDGPGWAAAQDAARLNTPDWLWDSWSRAYGADRAKAIAEAHLHEAPLDLTVKDDPAGWAERLGAQVLPTGSLRRPPGGTITELPGFESGAWWVQDAAAALPARLFGAVAGQRVIDLCAAPGGKTAQLAAAGARVTALDRSERRLQRLAANLARLGLGAELVAADAASWRPEAEADGVLLDAPCTATGAIRRHPDVLHLKGPADVAKLAAAQDRLLAHAVTLVRPGGTLVYCTCSLQPEEGEARVDALLAAGAPVVRWPITPGEVGGLAELVNARGELRTLPCHLPGLGGLDGFFVARLRRTA